jgi:hypothetical protein
LFTGYSSRISEEAASRMGIRFFAMKPLNLKKMAHLVRKALDSQ